MEKKAKFTMTTMMPFNSCPHCEMDYVVQWVQECSEEGSYDPDDWGVYFTRMYQSPPYCPYCGKKIIVDGEVS